MSSFFQKNRTLNKSNIVRFSHNCGTGLFHEWLYVFMSKTTGSGSGSELRERVTAYNADLGSENDGLSQNNGYFWNQNS